MADLASDQEGEAFNGLFLSLCSVSKNGGPVPFLVFSVQKLRSCLDFERVCGYG